MAGDLLTKGQNPPPPASFRVKVYTIAVHTGSRVQVQVPDYRFSKKLEKNHLRKNKNYFNL